MCGHSVRSLPGDVKEKERRCQSIQACQRQSLHVRQVLYMCAVLGRGMPREVPVSKRLLMPSVLAVVPLASRR